MEILNNPTFLDRTNLQGEWILNGDATDTSGNGNNGTATNVTWVSADRGYASEVADFNGSSSDIEDNPNNTYKYSSGTLCFWVNADTIPTGSSNADIVLRYQTNNTGVGPYYGWQFQLYDSQIRFSFKDSGGADVSTLIGTSVSVGEWAYIVITYDGTTIQFYKNGVADSSTSGVTPAWDTNMQLIMGCFESLGAKSRFFDGSIGLLRIYDTTLSQDEIKNLYLEGLRVLGPKSLLFNNTNFSKYSLPNLENGKVLEISRAAVSGTYYDQSGNGNNSTTITAVTDTTVGLNNKMTFNGSTSDLNMGDTPDVGTQWTFCATIKKSDTTIDFIACKNDGTGDHPICLDVLTTGEIRVYYVVGVNQLLTGVTQIQTGDYYRIIATRNGGTLRLYINGVLDKEQTGLSASAADNNDNFKIGNGDSVAGRNWNGDISNVCLYTRVFSEEEVQQDFYSNFIS